MTTFNEYPKWLHADGRESVLVANAEGEAEQMAAWDALSVPSVTVALAVETPPVTSAVSTIDKAPVKAPATKPTNALTQPQKRTGARPKPRNGQRR